MFYWTQAPDLELIWKDIPGHIRAVVTRNKGDYSASKIPVLSPDEYLVNRGLAVE
jgi:hypothetical protein